MQNLEVRAACSFARAAALFAVLLFASLCALAIAAPHTAWAKSHECTSDSITAQVEEDGSLHVVDSRTYDFSGSYTLTAAVLDPPDNGSVKVNGVSVVDEEGTTTKLTKVSFQKKWRTTGGPGSGHYAIDTAENTVYAFSNSTDESKTFVFDYTYSNAVNRYNDCSVLYWKFIGSNWDVDTENVTMTVTLPIASGDSMRAGDNVLAFGHGSLDGNITTDDANGQVVYTVPSVASGSFAEARIAFPRTWTPNVSSKVTYDEDQLSTVKQEEEQWKKETDNRRLISALLLIIPILLSILMIVLGIRLFLRYGKEYKPKTRDKYWRDVPEKGVNPLVIARLWRENKQSDNDLATELMYLSCKGVVRIDRVPTEKDAKRKAKRKKDNNFILKKTGTPLMGDDPIANKAYSFVFEKMGDSSGTVTLDQIEAYGQDNPEDYSESMKDFQFAIDNAVYKEDFFEAKGEKLKGRFKLIGILVLIVAVIVSGAFENFAPFIGLLPGSVFLIVMSRFMTRMSKRAVEIKARCEALKRWFEDFTHLDEAVPTDAKVWGELLVYAYIFGVAEQVSQNLTALNPDIWQDEYLAPSAYWYYNPYAAAPYAATGSMDGFFGDAFENTMASVNDALNAVTGGDDFDFGGGGGFSVGGGGGFGGGGGGFSR